MSEVADRSAPSNKVAAKAFDNAVARVALESLRPRFKDDGHSGYVELLVNELGRDDPGAARNIALAGGYGSGKSSILTEVARRLAAESGSTKSARNVTIAFGTLDPDEAGAVAEQSPAADGATADREIASLSAQQLTGARIRAVTNWVQREIVKQLLYRERGARLGGRFHRSEPFSWGRAIVWGVALAVAVTVIAAAGGAIDTLQASGLEVLGPFGTMASAVVLLAASIAVAQRLAHGRIRIRALSAGGAGLTLEDRSDSYFDEYLDEIVEFFRVSGTRVVFFEDLDRFQTPHIFETLHTLNDLLNTAKQLEGSRPIKFVYAVRDSIFETDSASTSGAINRDRKRLTPAERAELAATNRTKFFDLIVPIVPFISQENVRELLEEEFPTGDERRPELLALMAQHLNDMRMIKNIRNEYSIFAANRPALTDLTASGLLALVVYKNLHLEDFERIKPGRSRLDVLRLLTRRLITAETGRLLNEEVALSTQLSKGLIAVQELPKLAERVSAYFADVARMSGNAGNFTLTAGGAAIDPAHLDQVQTWRAIVSAGSVLVTAGRNVDIPVGRIESVLGVKLDVDDWERSAQARLQEQLDLLRQKREFLRKATMRSLYSRTDISFDPSPVFREQVRAAIDVDLAEGRQAFRSLASSVLASPIAEDLVAAGFIDENFALYVARFYDSRVSITAKNFLLHNVRQQEPDIDAQLSPIDAKVVIEEAGLGFLATDVARNLSIFDYLLDTEPFPIDRALDRLSHGGPDEESFILRYLRDGKHPIRLVARLSPGWAGIFKFFAKHQEEFAGRLPAMLDAALSHVGDETAYADGAEVTLMLSREPYPAILTDVDGRAARAAVRTMSRLGVRFSNLEDLGAEALDQVIEQHAYPLTPRTLRAVAAPGQKMSLDALDYDERIYARVLEDLETYLRIKPTNTRAIADPAKFTSVLEDAFQADPAHTHDLIFDSTSACKVASIQSVDPSLWSSLLRHRRLDATAENVLAYLERDEESLPEVDADLAEFLRGPARLKAVGIAQDRRIELAVAVANTPLLPPQVKVRRIQNLELAKPLALADVTVAQPGLLGELLAKKLLEDSAANLDLLLERPWPTAESYLARSAYARTWAGRAALTPQFVQSMLNARRFHPRAQRAVFDRVVAGQLDQSAKTIAAAARAVAELGWDISMLQYEALTKTAPLPSDVAAALVRRLQPLPATDDLPEVLTKAGPTYADLVYRRFHSQSSVPATDANAALLDLLKERGMVGDWHVTKDGKRLVASLRKQT